MKRKHSGRGFAIKRTSERRRDFPRTQVFARFRRNEHVEDRLGIERLGQITRETRLNLRRYLQGMPEENQGRICEIRADITFVLGLFARSKIDDAARGLSSSFSFPVRLVLTARTRMTRCGKGSTAVRERRDFSVQMRHLRPCKQPESSQLILGASGVP